MAPSGKNYKGTATEVDIDPNDTSNDGSSIKFANTPQPPRLNRADRRKMIKLMKRLRK